MLTINARPQPRLSPNLLDRLQRIPPAALGHVLDVGFMDGGLRPLGRRQFALCGPAFTVKSEALDSAVVHYALGMAEPGDVLVIDRSGDTKYACFGEMTALAAKTRGLAGTIVDGPVTDIVEIEQMEYLVFSRGISPVTTRALAVSGEINTVVQCGGVNVAPGDIILADDNGILVIAPDDVTTMIEHGERRVGREDMIREHLRLGEALDVLSGARDKIEAALAAQQHAEGSQ